MIKKVLTGALALVALSGASQAQAGMMVPNDPFASPQELTGAEAAHSANNQTATREDGEPDHAGLPAAFSLWYRYTAPANGTIAVDTCTTTVDPRIAVYTGDALASLTPVASDMGSCDTMRIVAVDGSRVSFPATAGTTYRIAVDSNGGGDITTHLVFTADPVTLPPADTAAPDTAITAAPEKKVRRKRATFAFSSNEGGVGFECSLNGAAFSPCASPITVRGEKGRNTFAARARDAAGNLDASPATYSWKVKKKRRK